MARDQAKPPRTALMGQRLWKQAQRDLESARTLLNSGIYYAAANFAHQAAEKSLKAAHWHLRTEEPPWTHDLGKCVDQVAEHVGNIPAAVELAIDLLDPMFEPSRYPSSRVDEPIPADLITEDDGHTAVTSAQEVMLWVQVLLRQPPSRARRGKSC